MRNQLTSVRFGFVAAIAIIASVAIATPAHAVSQKVTTVNGISLLNEDGVLQSSFAQGTGFGGDYGDAVKQIARQSDGDIVAIGVFTAYNGTSGLGRIARLHPDGTLDTSFVTASNGGFTIGSILNTVALQPDGKILVGGFMSTYGGADLTDGGYTPRVIRLNADGSLDTSFNAPKLPTSGSAVQIVFDTVAYEANNSVQRFVVASDYNVYRVNAVTGALDTSFSGDGLIDGYFATVTQQSDGKLLAGEFSNCNGSDNGVSRYNVNGTLDTSFNTDGIVPVCYGFGQSAVYSISVDDDGKIAFGGLFISVDGTGGFSNFALLNADGSVDTTMTTKPQLNDQVFSVYAQPDGKIVVGGQLTATGINENAVPYGYILRINADGTADTTGYNDGQGYNARLWSLVSDGSGGLWVGGNYTGFDGASDALPSVTLDANGGFGTMSPVSGDGSITAPDCTFTLPGMEFDGWTADEAGTGTRYNEGDTVTLTEDMTLYAQWRAAGGGSGGGSGSGAGSGSTASLASTGLDAGGWITLALGVALLGVGIAARGRIRITRG